MLVLSCELDPLLSAHVVLAGLQLLLHGLPVDGVKHSADALSWMCPSRCTASAIIDLANEILMLCLGDDLFACSGLKLSCQSR